MYKFMFLFLYVCVFSACTEQDNEKQEINENAKVTANEAAEEDTERKAGITPCIFVQHMVADYEVWKNGFDEYDSIRQELGMNVLNIFRVKEDTNNVIIIMEVRNFGAAYKYAYSSELIKVMGKLGVIGEPVIKMLNATQYPAKQEKTSFIFIQHRVADYKIWRKGFDKHANIRQKYGMYALNVFYLDGNPNNVLILMEVDNFGSAAKYVLSQDFRETMEKWGVISDLEVIPVFSVR